MSGHFYEAFGRRLKSSMPLPELREVAPGPARWEFDVVDALPEMEAAFQLGREVIYSDMGATLFRHAHGHRILVDDTGSFDLAEQGTLIRWLPRPDPWWDFGRNHLVGRVLATAMHLEDIVTLHASAVETSDGVVGFLAPKHFGKSTLAMMLFQAGARFVTDDSLPIRARRDGVTALPGVHSLRVRAGDDDAERLIGRPITGQPGRDGKVVLPPLPSERVLRSEASLGALYLLAPCRAEPGTGPVRRERLDPVTSSVYLVAHAKIAAMLGPSHIPGILDVTTTIASTVPVHTLEIAQDLEALPTVVERLMEWHGLPDPGPA